MLPTLHCRRARRAPGFTLSGTKLFVGDAHLADILVVAGRTRNGSTLDAISLFLVPNSTLALEITLLPTQIPACD
jgi:alkylation response protein AidB-like acyl-CoA dehydrogenase